MLKPATNSDKNQIYYCHQHDPNWVYSHYRYRIRSQPAPNTEQYEIKIDQYEVSLYGSRLVIYKIQNFLCNVLYENDCSNINDFLKLSTLDGIRNFLLLK